MPRESIPDMPGGAVAEVTWGSQGHVQLGVLGTDTATFVEWCRNLVAVYDETVAKTSPSLPAGATPVLPGESLGMWWTPSREQINQLIRVLRRGRNAAYGADE